MAARILQTRVDDLAAVQLLMLVVGVSMTTVDSLLYHDLYNKYQLLLTNPRYKIVLQTEPGDVCDKLQWSSVGALSYYQLS